MTDSIKHVGVDVHASSMTVATADHTGRQVRLVGQFATDAATVRKIVKQLAGKNQALHFWYEAGPTGYELYRQLTAMGVTCTVVAPSLIPRKAGDRVKTDTRDAKALARLARAGELTAVWVPDALQEAMRDLTRCREDAKAMQRQARQQLNAFLLRYGRRYDSGKSKWTDMHTRWLSKQTFDQPMQTSVFEMYRQAVDQTSVHLEQLNRTIREQAEQWCWYPVVQGLMALRGVDLLTAVTIMTELGDLRRFSSPRQLMAYLGLVPSESSSGPRVRRGGITKTGNAHVRRLLVESGWSYHYAARMTKHLQRKAQAASPAAQAIAWKAQKRLCARYRHLIERGKLKTQACTAVARELCGFIWAIGQTFDDRVWESKAGPKAELTSN